MEVYPILNIYLEALLRTLLSVAVLFVLARIDGAKQVSQLTFYDYIVGITAGSIAASMCIESDIDIWVCLIAVVLFMLSSMLFSVLSSKSIFLRRVLTGQSIFLIARGEIRYDGLRRARFDLSDLMRELRSQGYFNINQVNYAILESNGNVSVMPKAGDRPMTATEQGVSLPEDGLMANVIEDGKMLKGNLKAFGKDADWLQEEIRAQGCKEMRDIMLATLNENGELNIYYKNEEEKDGSRTVFQ
jgi:hypothetical protein